MAAGAVATYVKKRELSGLEIQRTEVVRRGIVGYDRYGIKKGKRGRKRHTRRLLDRSLGRETREV